MKVIVTTCGTSLLTNGAERELLNLLRSTANHKERELAPEDKDAIDLQITERRQKLLGASVSEARRLSAELNGLLGIIEQEGGIDQGDQHFLVHTDTYQGERAAELIRDWCTEIMELPSQLVGVDSLNTRSVLEFEEGISELVKWCQETLPGYRDYRYKVIFNLVGGFKSLQGYMQTLGMQFADECVYIFEGEDALLRIPRLPFDLDNTARDTIYQNLNLFRRLYVFSEYPVNQEVCNALPEVFFKCMDGECVLSPWGRIVYSKFIETEYGKRLLDSPSEKLRISESVRKEVDRMDRELIARMNKKLDELAFFLETGNNLNSLNFHGLQNQRQGPVYEFYLWSDKDAGRGFGSYEDGVFVFKTMSEHL